MDYLEEVKQYEKNAIAFNKTGKRTYLAKGGIEGNDETCYMHVMRFYFPEMARTTFERHNLGVGIFNMQGFVRKK